MFYFNNMIKKLDIVKESQQQQASIENFRNLIHGLSLTEIKNNIDILTEGNKIFFDKTRKFMNYNSYALLKHGRWEIQFFLKYLSLDEFDSFCDIGCGHGQLAKAASERGFKKVLGIDIKENDRWNEYIKGTKNLTYKKMDILKDSMDEKFQVVTSIAAFEHFEHPELMLNKMSNFVKNGGYLFIHFAPIWRSTNGHHLYRHIQFPWYHLIFSDDVRMEYYKKFNIDYSVHYFNKWSADDFMIMFLQNKELSPVTFEPMYEFRHFSFAQEFLWLFPGYSLEDLMMSGFTIVYKK